MPLLTVHFDRQQVYPLGAAVRVTELAHDMHNVLHRLRSAEPVSWLPAINGWVVSRHDLAIEVMRDATTYTVDHANFSTGRVIGQSMLSLDGPTHLQHRRPFEPPFRARDIQQRFANGIETSIERLLDHFIEVGSAELRRDYAGPIATETMIAALGLPPSSLHDILIWYDAIVDAVTRVTAGEPVSQAGRAAFAALQATLLPIIRGSADSLLAVASGAATDLTEAQIVSNAAVLLFGGIETTEGMIANALYHLLTNPDGLAQVRANPTLIPRAIEESLRLEPAAAVVDRYATRDVQLADALIKRDDLVQVSLAGANRDPNIFPHPDRFDLTRPNLRSHVTFAQGPHVCLGLHLARLETQLALARLLERMPTLTHVEPQPPTGLVFRKPNSIHITLAQ